MVNRKTLTYYLAKITQDIRFIILHSEGVTLDEFESDEVPMLQINSNIRKCIKTARGIKKVLSAHSMV